MAWTKEQLRAIDENGCNILVSAGAGSGKTSVLTERVIRKLLKGESLKSLIILTFTNAAAFNMKKKIKEAIIKANNEKLSSELEYIDQANIMTFDAFTLSLVKKYAYYLNITPDICILSSNELDIIHNKLLNEVIDEFFCDKRFEKLISKYTVVDLDIIVSSLLDIYNNYLVNMVDPIEYLDNYNYSGFKKTYEDYIEAIVNEKNMIIETLNEVKKLDYEDVLYSSIFKACKPLMEAKSIDDIKSKRGISIPTFPKKSDCYDEKQKEKITKAREKFRKKITEFLNGSLMEENECYDEYIKMKEYVEIIIDVLKTFIRKYNDYTIAHNCFSFTDVALLAIKLLKENKEITNSIKYNTNEILIDEYQDTSDIQETLISILENNNCYMVGDIKQSIYRFRNANPDIFRKKFDEYGLNNGGKRIDLTKNFRSRKEVLYDINALFENMMSRDFGGVDYKNGHKLEFGNTSYVGDMLEGIEYHLFVQTEEKIKTEQRRINEFLFVIQDILWKVKNENAKYSDFAILTRKKGNYNVYSDICKKYDIPLEIESNEQFIRSDEILVLISILSYLNDEKNMLSYCSILRSFLYEETDEYLLKNINDNHEVKEICNHIRKKMPYITLKDLLQMIYDEFAIYEKIDKLPNPSAAEYRLLFMLSKSDVFAKIDNNINTMIEYLELLKKKSYDDKKADIEFSVDKKGQNEAVYLMTIHKSKGLEFKYCYIIETDSKLTGNKQRGEDKPIKFYPEYGFIVYNENLEKSYLERAMKNKERLNALHEELRMLYVALTRAKEKAIVFTYQMEEGERKTREIDLKTKMCYNTFFNMFDSAYETVRYEKNKTSKLIEAKGTEKLVGEKMSFKMINMTKEEKQDKTISKAVDKILTKEEKQSIDYGTEIHNIFENIDLLHPNLENIKEKAIIERFLKQDIFKKNIINVYKEYEFMYDEKNGKMDLVLESNDEMIIVDYKTNDIDKEEYVIQLETYATFIKTMTRKKVSGYLYSLIQGKLKRVV